MKIHQAAAIASAFALSLAAAGSASADTSMMATTSMMGSSSMMTASSSMMMSSPSPMMTSSASGGLYATVQPPMNSVIPGMGFATAPMTTMTSNPNAAMMTNTVSSMPTMAMPPATSMPSSMNTAGSSMTTGMTTSSAMPSGMSSNMSMLASGADLSYGSTGDSVSALQAFLTAQGFLTIPSGVSMGYFGSLTKAALAAYQTSVGLPAHGYFGALTRAKLSAMSMTTGTMPGTPGTTTSPMNGTTGVMVGGALMTPNKDIVTNAGNASNVTTLVAAVQAAGLVPTLQGTGPFTVFAPDNNAFAKLPAGTVSNLLMPANAAQLKDILTYHVVPGKYMAADLYDGEKLTTVEGKLITINKSATGQISVNGSAMVETPDVVSSNGVTFVIDTVLMPPTSTSSMMMSTSSMMMSTSSMGVMVGGAMMSPSKDIVTNAGNASNLTTVVAAVQAAGLVSTLQGTGPFTVFAPDNTAFGKLASGTVSTLLMPANLAQLKDILTYHVVAGSYTSASLYNGEQLTTVEGKKLTIGKSSTGQLTINGTAMVEIPDIMSTNGVSFVIDTVLMPPSM